MNLADSGYQYLTTKLWYVVTETKFQLCILNGLEAHSLIDDEEFLEDLNENEKNVWINFVDVIRSLWAITVQNIVHYMMQIY